MFFYVKEWKAFVLCLRFSDFNYTSSEFPTSFKQHHFFKTFFVSPLILLPQKAHIYTTPMLHYVMKSLSKSLQKIWHRHLKFAFRPMQLEKWLKFDISSNLLLRKKQSDFFVVYFQSLQIKKLKISSKNFWILLLSKGI